MISNEGGNLTVNGGKYICNGRNRYFFAFTLANGINQVENVTIESKYGAIDVVSNCKNAVIESSIITAKWAYDGAISCWPRQYSDVMELYNVDAQAVEEGDALRVEAGTVTVNGGNYKSGQGCAIGTQNSINTDLSLTINGGTYQMVIMTVLLQILGAMGIRQIRENVIFTFTEARLLAANCWRFMVIMPKR